MTKRNVISCKDKDSTRSWGNEQEKLHHLQCSELYTQLRRWPGETSSAVGLRAQHTAGAMNRRNVISCRVKDSTHSWGDEYKGNVISCRVKDSAHSWGDEQELRWQTKTRQEWEASRAVKSDMLTKNIGGIVLSRTDSIKALHDLILQHVEAKRFRHPFKIAEQQAASSQR